METRQIHVKDLSTVTGVMQYEHDVQSIYFLGLEDFEGDIYLSMESDQYSNEAVPLSNNTFVIGQPMTLYNVTYTCQIYGVLNDGEKIQLSKRFRLMIDKSNDIQGDSSEYPIDPNFENSIIEFVNEQKSELNSYTESQKSSIQATGDAVIASIPSDYTALEQATYNAYPTESESGNPIYFDDGADDIPVKELIVNLEPKQEGSGDPSPSNVRQISGFDGVTVKRLGKNLLPSYSQSEHTINGLTLTNNNGKYVLNGTTTARASFDITVHLDVGSYKLGFNNPTGNGSVSIYIILPPSTMVYNLPFTGANMEVPIDITESADYIFRITIASSVTLSNFELAPMIRLVSVTDSTFEPYIEPTEYSITFPSEVGTVYGGSLNVTTGVLTVDRYYLEKTWGEFGSESVLGTNERRQLTIASVDTFQYPPIDSAQEVSNVAPFEINYANDRVSFYFNKRQITMILPVGTSDDTVIQACVPLLNPITYQFTPTEVSTLLGSNTIQSDGSMDLQYRADISKVIEKLTNAIISLGANI